MEKGKGRNLKVKTLTCTKLFNFQSEDFQKYVSPYSRRPLRMRTRIKELSECCCRRSFILFTSGLRYILCNIYVGTVLNESKMTELCSESKFTNIKF